MTPLNSSGAAPALGSTAGLPQGPPFAEGVTTPGIKPTQLPSLCSLSGVIRQQAMPMQPMLVAGAVQWDFSFLPQSS